MLCSYCVIVVLGAVILNVVKLIFRVSMLIVIRLIVAMLSVVAPMRRKTNK
jgi:hypothetical protein